jgi:hypothetical protein
MYKPPPSETHFLADQVYKVSPALLLLLAANPC